MKDLGITKGKWMRHTRYPKVIIAVDEIGCSLTVGTKEDNSLLIDAGNTAQKCGLLPSELLKQRDELLKVANDYIEAFNRVGPLPRGTMDMFINGIKNATK